MFKDQVMLLEEPMRGVAPMLIALRKLQSSSEHLTTLHSDFLLLCFLAKCYKFGVSILEDSIFEVDQPRDLFLYCYSMGMICIGQNSISQSYGDTTQCCNFPMSIVSAIAVVAYKKYILVSLIHIGQVCFFCSAKESENFCQHYLELVNSYNTGKISELETCMQTNKDKFESGKNLGLVKQLVSSMYKRNIQRLTHTYLTLSLLDIANTVQLNTPKETEMHVLQIVDPRWRNLCNN